MSVKKLKSKKLLPLVFLLLILSIVFIFKKEQPASIRAADVELTVEEEVVKYLNVLTPIY